MNIFEAIRMSFQMIARKKMQSFLTMLGIIIGVSAVVIVLSIGASAQEFILKEIKIMGTDLIAVNPGKASDRIPAGALGIVNTSLKYEDGEKILRKNYSNIKEIAMSAQGNSNIVFEDNSLNASVIGSTEGYLIVEKANIELGRFFTKEEEQSYDRIVVLGSKVAKDLFKEEDPISKKVKIRNMNFKVIGVLEEKGSGLTQDQDGSVIIPMKTAQKRLFGIGHINFMRIKVKDENLIDATVEDVTMALREIHNISDFEENDFRVNTTIEALEAMSLITDALKFFLVAVSFISLVVGGFGIMNIMLATVEERISEIGLRKALGARNYHITIQFLIETISITFLSGMIGILLGSFVAFIISKVMIILNITWVFLVPVSSILFATIISISIGLIFGILPAKKASKLDPIEALSYE